MRRLKLFFKNLSSHRRPAGIINLLAALVLTATLSIGPLSANVHASVNDFYFSNYVVDYYLSQNEDGTSHLHVVEEFTAEFPDYDQNRGFIRSIAYTNNDGTNITIVDVDSLNLTATRNGETTNVVDRIEKNTSTGTFDVYLQNPSEYVHGTQTYVLEYDMNNVIIGVDADNRAFSFSNQGSIIGQEFYWDTNGTDWQQRFDAVTANVHFVDLDLADVLGKNGASAHASGNTSNTSCYTGFYGAAAHDCSVTTLPDGYSFFTDDALRAGENLTINVELAATAFALPTYTYTLKDFLPWLVNGVLILVIVVLILLAIHKHRKLTRANREYFKNLAKPVQYLPPKGLTVGQASFFDLNKIKTQSDLTVATLLELAVKHKIEIIKGDPAQPGKKTWRIRIKNLQGLTRSEQLTLELAAGNRRNLSVGQIFTLKKHSPTARRSALAVLIPSENQLDLEEKGLLKPDNKETSRQNSKSAILAVAIVFILVFFFPFMIVAFEAVGAELDILTFFLFTGLIFATIFYASIGSSTNSSKLTNCTQAGLDVAGYLMGLREYIQLAEADRLQFLQSVKGADTTPEGRVKLYERLLPYAVLFGCEKSWLTELGHLYANLSTRPEWYSDTAAVNTLVFLSVADFSSLSSASRLSVNGTLSTSGFSGTGGGSSSSGGGGGGGFSGGGGGGGGGRGL